MCPCNTRHPASLLSFNIVPSMHSHVSVFIHSQLKKRLESRKNKQYDTAMNLIGIGERQKTKLELTKKVSELRLRER